MQVLVHVLHEIVLHVRFAIIDPVDIGKSANALGQRGDVERAESLMASADKDLHAHDHRIYHCEENS